MDMVETISKIKAEELKERYRQAAFAAYLSGAGGGEEDEQLTFADFLSKIGLSENSEVEDESPQEVTKEEALAKAQNILATFQWGE
jgi:hypothetical protein